MASILLTGASSFTGFWIAEALSRDGHQVHAALRRRAEDYDGVRGLRVARLEPLAALTFEAPVASAAFLDLLGQRPWDLLAHHAADIPDYRSAAYDPVAGLARNMDGMDDAIHALAARGGRAVLATGTVFETGEGEGSPHALAATPYGLSKALTNQALRHLTRWAGLGFGRFVVPAPFGPWEQGRLVWSLFQAWTEGRPAEIRTPAYVRDHLPAPLLAAAYAEAVRDLLAGGEGELAARPSGVVSSIGAFARRVAGEVRARTPLACEIIEHPQTAFPEPRSRVNDRAWRFSGAAETAFWDSYVAYYLDLQASGLLQATPA